MSVIFPELNIAGGVRVAYHRQSFSNYHNLAQVHLLAVPHPFVDDGVTYRRMDKLKGQFFGLVLCGFDKLLDLMLP